MMMLWTVYVRFERMNFIMKEYIENMEITADTVREMCKSLDTLLDLITKSINNQTGLISVVQRLNDRMDAIENRLDKLEEGN
jgi:uncharacterized protein YgbK (DUF1537 family)